MFGFGRFYGCTFLKLVCLRGLEFERRRAWRISGNLLGVRDFALGDKYFLKPEIRQKSKSFAKVKMTKLRIISGEFGGRLISSTDNILTHPMGDRVRSALFAKIFSRKNLDGARVLDLFAGTGAIGLEALSRGAGNATFVEKNSSAAKIIRENIKLLGLENRAKVLQNSLEKFAENLANLSDEEKFDFVFLDPPYGISENLAEIAKLEANIEKVVKYACAKNALMVLSYRSGEALPNLRGVVVVDNPKSYGEASLIFYETEN